jgi:hypothetical protein
MSSAPKKRSTKPAGKVLSEHDDLTAHLMDKGRKRRGTMAKLSGADREHARRNDLRPKLQIIDVAVDALKEAERHPRKVTSTQLARVKRSIEAYGVVVPLLISENNEVIAGHVVLAAARILRLHTLPCCVISHLMPNQQKMLAIALNRAGETGEWDFETLKDVLEDLVEDGEDIFDTVFDGAEIDSILQDDPDLIDPVSDEIVVPNFVTTQPGDVWDLGRHVVGCGDARDEAYIAGLMGSDVAEAAFLDAPYNVPIKGHVTGAGHHREFVMGTGEMSRDAFYGFLGKSHKALLPHLQPGGVIFSCMDWRSVHVLMTAAEKAGFEILNVVVWNKTNAGMGSLYRSQHELIVVLKKPGAKPINH